MASTVKTRTLVLRPEVTRAAVGERLERAGWVAGPPDAMGDVRRWTRKETTAEYGWVQDYDFGIVTVGGGDWPERTKELSELLDTVSSKEIRAEIRTNEIARIHRALRMLEETGDITLIHEIMVLRGINEYGIAEAAERAYRRCGVATGMLAEHDDDDT